jgi:hypothetical protein
VVCGPADTDKTFLLEAVGQAADDTSDHLAWFTLEHLACSSAVRPTIRSPNATARILRAATT